MSSNTTGNNDTKPQVGNNPNNIEIETEISVSSVLSRSSLASDDWDPDNEDPEQSESWPDPDDYDDNSPPPSDLDE